MPPISGESLTRNWADFLLSIINTIFYAPLQNLMPCRVQCINKENDDQLKRLSMFVDKVHTIESANNLNVRLTKRIENTLLRMRNEELLKTSKPHGYTGWNETAIRFLKSLYYHYSRRSDNGRVSLDHFLAICGRLDFEVDEEMAQSRFWFACGAKDGYLAEDEFLWLMYNFEPPRPGQEMCDVALKIVSFAEDEDALINMDPQIRFMVGLT